MTEIKQMVEIAKEDVDIKEEHIDEYVVFGTDFSQELNVVDLTDIEIEKEYLGFSFSYFVIERIIASFSTNMLSSIEEFSICAFILFAPGSMDITPSIPPIFFICRNCDK